MARSNKFDYQTAIETSLIANPDGLTLDQLLERSGLAVDRSTLFRHLAKLIEQGRAERLGKARASRYRSPTLARIAPDPEPEPEQGLRPGLGHAPELMAYPQAQDTPFPPRSEVEPLPQTGRAVPAPIPAAAPDNGEVVNKAVRKIVREWKRFSRVNLEIYLSLLVQPAQMSEVAAAVEKELAGLHQGNLAKFGLTPAEFAGFKPPASPGAAGE